MGGFEQAEIDRLPIDLLSHIFVLVTSFKDLAQASVVCKEWKQAVEQSMAWRERLSFTGWKMDDQSTARLVLHAYNLKELDISRSRWGCQITDVGLYQISSAKCVSNLTSISVWGMPGITDKGIVPLVDWLSKTFFAMPQCQGLYVQLENIFNSVISRTTSLQHLNIGGTFVTDESLFAIAESCPHLKTIILWSCRHVTESGLSVLVNKCRKLESINVWGTRVPAGCFISLLTISPALKIKPQGQLLDVGRVSMWPIV